MCLVHQLIKFHMYNVIITFWQRLEIETPKIAIFPQRISLKYILCQIRERLIATSMECTRSLFNLFADLMRQKIHVNIRRTNCEAEENCITANKNGIHLENREM